jgi:hypothetical protein
MLRLIGTTLPDDLILVHEHSDHYSLQPAKEMSLSGNNSQSPQYVHVLNHHTSRADWEDNRFLGKELDDLEQRAVASEIPQTDGALHFLMAHNKCTIVSVVFYVSTSDIFINRMGVGRTIQHV